MIRPLGGHPRPLDVVRMGWRASIAQPVATITAALVVAVICLVVFATTGRSVAAEAEVMSTIDSTGTRLIVVSDSTGEAQLNARSVDVIASLDQVSWAFGLGPAKDVQNEAVSGGTAAPMRDFVGTFPADIRLTGGRLPVLTPEGIVGKSARTQLGLSEIAGSLVAQSNPGNRVSVVGEFVASGPLKFLNKAVLRKTEPTRESTVRYIYLTASNVAEIDEVVRSVEAVLIANERQSIKVESSEGVISLREAISGQMGASARALMATVLGVGLILIAITMLGAVSARRRDFGRRRALGASRSTIVALVLVQSAVSAIIGTIIGTIAGLLINHLIAAYMPPMQFTLGVAALAILVTLMGSVPPALAAAFRDPVRILRVP